MRDMFQSLEIGLAVAVLVILIMLTAYFQAPGLPWWRLPPVPAVLCGVVLALWITGTTLNIESFMGAIMAVGVAVSNAILLVSFGDRHRREEGMPADRAAITAAKGRLRPIIMTGCAMIAGMIPMSLGLEQGSEQNAPLGRAVIGGMALATARHTAGPACRLHAALGRASNQSPSLDPDDPASAHYDPIHPSNDPGNVRHRRSAEPPTGPNATSAPSSTGDRRRCQPTPLSRGPQPSLDPSAKEQAWRWSPWPFSSRNRRAADTPTRAASRQPPRTQRPAKRARPRASPSSIPSGETSG